MHILWRCAAVLLLISTQPSIPAEWTRPAAPFRVIGNIHYVGTQDLASWLITSPEGHILIDSGVEQNAPLIAAGIRTLGFELRDVKWLLTTQAHFDHVAAHAELKTLTGAQVAASAADAALLERGGKGDYLFGPSYHFDPVSVERRIKDGDVLKIGGIELHAHLTPGHTQGATTWSMTVTTENGPVAAVFVASTHVNDGTRLIANPVYPTIAEDFASSIDRLSKMKVEVFLGAHMSSIQGMDKARRLRAGATPNPFIDPSGFATYIERSRNAFEAELARQKK